MTPAQDAKSQIETILPSLTETIAELSGNELLQVTIKAIKEHRVLTDKVDTALLRLEAYEGSGGAEADLNKTYEDAVLNSQVQIALVAVLTQKLGYVPDVP